MSSGSNDICGSAETATTEPGNTRRNWERRTSRNPRCPLDGGGGRPAASCSAHPTFRGIPRQWLTLREARRTPRRQTKNPCKTGVLAAMPSGEGGIRTPGALSGTPVFETGTISLSVTSPSEIIVAAGKLRQACRPPTAVSPGFSSPLRPNYPCERSPQAESPQTARRRWRANHRSPISAGQAAAGAACRAP